MNSNNKSHPKFTRNKFDVTEDAILTMLVSQMGVSNWKAIAEKMNGRTARQCRDRWKHYISPSTNTSEWTEEEDRRLLAAFQMVGRHWSVLSKMFPGRSSIGVRNHVWKLLRPYQTNNSTDIQETVVDSSNESGSEAPDETLAQENRSQPKILLPSIDSLPFSPPSSLQFPQISCMNYIPCF